ncbi:hypothetical protein BaRGS_00011104 [Batillaria attramentaria]|uniref:Uncharacterized protein n=1 Tax=Batillaria attramentaria TaxID=370345 RepID=A0ABD0LFB9_9CAEN
MTGVLFAAAEVAGGVRCHPTALGMRETGDGLSHRARVEDAIVVDDKDNSSAIPTLFFWSDSGLPWLWPELLSRHVMEGSQCPLAGAQARMLQCAPVLHCGFTVDVPAS